MPERSVPIARVLPEHVRFVRGIARSLLYDEHEAEDAVQDTMLRALERPPDPQNIRGWLRVVVRNFALRRLREERRRRRRELRNAPASHISSPEEVAARIEGQRRVIDAVRDLPEPYRSTIVHRYLDELTREEIAERLDVPLETVRTRLRRALRLLRERLDRDDTSSGPWVAALAPLLGLARPGAGGIRGALRTGSLSLAAKVLLAVGVTGSAALLLLTRDGASPQSRSSGTATASTSGGKATVASATSPIGEATSGALAVAGVVRDIGGDAVAGAQVAGADGTEFLTDGQGRFRVAASPGDARADVTVMKDGFLRWQGTLDALVPGEHVITLVRGAPVTVVVRATGGPVADAPVEAAIREERGVAGLWWSRRSETLGRQSTDVDGRAAFGAIPGGILEIRVDDPRYASWRDQVEISGSDPVAVEVTLTRGGDVLGRVTDPAGRPIADARVYAAAWPDRVARTRADGTYELRQVETGENRILVDADGFGTGFFGASLGWGKPVPVRVDAGRALRGIDIVLAPAIEVTGRIVDAAGVPVRDAIVATVVGPGCGRSVEASADARGRFVVGPFAVTDGRAIHLTFSAHGFVVDPVDADVPADGGTLDLGDVTARRTARIVGTVVDIDGEPVRLGRVRLVTGGREALSGSDGAFELFDVPPGSRWVEAAAHDPYRRSVPVHVDLEPGASTGVVLRLRRTLPIRGRVVSPGRLAAGTLVAAFAPDGCEVPVAQATAGEDGAFEIPGLPTGSYTVGVLRLPLEEETAPPDSRLEYTDDPLAVHLVVPGLAQPAAVDDGIFVGEPARAIAGSDDVTLVLPARGTLVEGRVTSAGSGHPLRSFEVNFIEYWRGLIPSGSEALDVADAGGRFTYSLREGTWAAEITAPGHASYRTPLFSSGADAVVDLGPIRLGAGGAIRGTVVDASADPVAYARLYLLGPQLQTNRRPIFTDAEGEFDAEAIAPGIHTVFILSPRHPFGIVRDVAIREGETSVVDVHLGRPSPVTLVVTDGHGAPVADADVSYTCDALFPLTSRLLRSHEPPGWGGYRTDRDGKLRKPFLPAARVSFRVVADGYARATRVVELKQDCETVVEIRLTREH